MGADFNGTIYNGTSSLACEVLREVIKNTKVAVTWDLLMASDDDVQAALVFFYGSTGASSQSSSESGGHISESHWHINQSKAPLQAHNRELWIRESDADTHIQVMFTIREWQSRNKHQRGPEATARRNQHKRQKQKAKKSQPKAPIAASEVSPELPVAPISVQVQNSGYISSCSSESDWSCCWV